MNESILDGADDDIFYEEQDPVFSDSDYLDYISREGI